MEKEPEEKKYAPVLPFDPGYGENFTTYWTMPYQCDRDACHPNVGMETGNVVKYYSYQMEEEPVAVAAKE